MKINLYNTKTRQKEPLRPVKPNHVSMYVCGPTVYDRAHLGNARSVVVFDVLFSLLCAFYGKENVTYVRNITDIDDKINTRAFETGKTISDITRQTSRWFAEDMKALGAVEPTYQPKATEYIAEILKMVECLIVRKHAYIADEHVLFRVESFANYGQLSRRSLDDMIAGARVEVASFKENPMDFVLWKPSSLDLPGWESPWGRGRPGWHIECSAMSKALLGDVFDIHGGGNDLIFPHHENEIAQSRCAHPGCGFASLWMHNEMLQIDGQKMSKSLGNFVTVRDLLDQDIDGEVVRLVLLSTHYRKPLDWTAKKVDEARKTLEKWRSLTRDIRLDHGMKIDKSFLSVLCDDLNIPGAIALLHQLGTKGNVEMLLACARLLGFLKEDESLALKGEEFDKIALRVLPKLSALRQKALETRDFNDFDRIKKSLSQASIEMRIKAKNTIELIAGTKIDLAAFAELEKNMQADFESYQVKRSEDNDG